VYYFTQKDKPTSVWTHHVTDDVKTKIENYMEDMMDTDNNGEVDEEEYKAKAKGGTTEEFQKYDLNGDGILERKKDGDGMVMDGDEKFGLGYFNFGKEDSKHSKHSQLFPVCRTVKEVVCIKRENSGNPIVECDTHSENKCLKVCRRKESEPVANWRECYEALCEGDIGTELCKAISITL